MKKISLLLLVLAIILAIITRFYKLGDAPAGLYLDEAGQGYSAYSILKTGKDEFGKSFPIVFRSFTDFKTPVYIYLVVPLIPIFGLTKFTVRLPSFIFSIFTLPLLFALINKITTKKYSAIIAGLSVFFLALSPWHILFGRTNFECNVALFFFLAGVYSFYLGLEKPKLMVVSALLFAIAIPAYHAQRVVTPLFLIALAIRYKKQIFKPDTFRYCIPGAVIAFILLLPTLSVMTTPGFLARASGLNIFSQSAHRPVGYIENYNGFFSAFINSPLYLTTKEFFSLYVSYFSPREIFILGDSGPRSSFPYLSTLFLWQYPLYLIGFYQIIRKKIYGELRFFTLALLFIAPIPAAVTRDPYSTIRSLQMVIPLNILLAIGTISVWEFIQNELKKYKTIISKKAVIPVVTLTFLVFTVYSLAKLYSSVIVLNEYYRGYEWNYGIEEVLEVLEKYPNYPVIFDNARNGHYIHQAFFLQLDPLKFQNDNFEVSPDNYYSDMNHIKDKVIGRIYNRPINWIPDLGKKQILVGDHLAISDQQIEVHNLILLSDIYYPNGEIAFRVVLTNPETIINN